VKVLVSKADLPAPLDLESELRYTAGQIRAQLGVEVDVHPVSTAHSQAHLLEQWFSAEIAPLYEAHGQFARESGRRKTAALCETVEAVLNAKLNGAVSVPEEQKEKLLVLERDLREAAGRLEDARVFCLRVSDEIRGLTPDALHQATSALLEVWTGAALNKEPETAVAAAIAKTAGRATQVHSHLRDLALILTAALQRTAQALGSDDASAEEEPLRPLARDAPFRSAAARRRDFTGRGFCAREAWREVGFTGSFGGRSKNRSQRHSRHMRGWSRTGRVRRWRSSN
jgi:hypothetical protein